MCRRLPNVCQLIFMALFSGAISNRNGMCGNRSVACGSLLGRERRKFIFVKRRWYEMVAVFFININLYCINFKLYYFKGYKLSAELKAKFKLICVLMSCIKISIQADELNK